MQERVPVGNYEVNINTDFGITDVSLQLTPAKIVVFR